MHLDYQRDLLTSGDLRQTVVILCVLIIYIMNPLKYTIRMSKKSKRKKSIAKQALDSIRKPVPPSGHAHEMAKDFKRHPKHKKHPSESYEESYENE